MAQKPSEALEDLADGRVAWEDADAAIRSWYQFFVYRAATWCLDAGTSEGIAQRLERVPQEHRWLIEEEAERLWHYRRSRS